VGLAMSLSGTSHIMSDEGSSGGGGAGGDAARPSDRDEDGAKDRGCTNHDATRNGQKKGLDGLIDENEHVPPCLQVLHCPARAYTHTHKSTDVLDMCACLEDTVVVWLHV
jgi:hypothetical protein